MKAVWKVIAKAWEELMLWYIFKVLVKFELQQNRFRFKKGDYVRYNWKAKYALSGTVYNEKGRQTFMIWKNDIYKDGSGVEYTPLVGVEIDSCDPFWLRRAKVSEIVIPKKPTI